MIDKLKYYMRAGLVALSLLAGNSVWANRPSLIIIPVLVTIDWENITEKWGFRDAESERQMKFAEANEKKAEESYRVYPGNESAMPLLAKLRTSECVGKPDKNIYAANGAYHRQANFLHHDLEARGVNPNETLDPNFTLLQGISISAELYGHNYFSAAGQVLARVVTGVCGKNGNIVLIPPNSRLLGIYHRVMEQGQIRLYVIWTHIEMRALRIKILSPGGDALYKSAKSGKVNSQFCRYLNEAPLLSRGDGGLADKVGVTDHRIFRTELCGLRGRQLPKAGPYSVFKHVPLTRPITVRVGHNLVFPDGDFYLKAQPRPGTRN